MEGGKLLYPIQSFEALILDCLPEAVYRAIESSRSIERLALQADLDEIERML